jgi:hypothetical protein
MENKNNSTVYYSLGAAAFIIIVILMFWLVKKDNSPVVNEEQNIEDTLTPVEDTSAGSVNTTAKTPSISYANALVKYKDTRIQLDKTCQATPNNVTYKNNTTIMVDNRAPVVRTVKIGSTYSIKAYGFKIIKLSSTTLPMTWLMDCDKSQNVATILLQK